MSSRDDILNAIRRNTRQKFERPSLERLLNEAITYADPVAAFSKTLEQVGGRAVELPQGETPGQLIARLYPDAKRVACAVTDLPGREQLPGTVFDPDTIDNPAELNGTDLAIISARLGVCENAACYIEQHVRHRALYFISEALVIILPKNALVGNMHEAFARLSQLPETPFACFISGPSKTADIEQALVMGAHGAREATVILV